MENKNHLYKYGIACSLNQVPSTSPIILRGDIEVIAKKAKEIGYDGIELQICNPQEFDWNNLKNVAKQIGMEFSAIATGREIVENKLWLLSDDPVIRRAAIDRLKIHIDMAEALGCMVIVGSMRANIPDFKQFAKYEGYHTEAIIELAEYAEGKNVKIVIENIMSSISNFMNTAKQVMDYILMIGRKNVGVHLDSYSMLIEDNNIGKAYEYCKTKLDYIHFSDSARLYPGGGNVDFKKHMHALMDIGYKGYITTECVPFPTEMDCARFALEYIHALETIVLIERSVER